jgi:DNA-binding NtrC family response regulator
MEFLGRSRAVAHLLELIERAAQVDVPVLLTGETGTGKSHLARLLHARSPRHAGPFVSANCAGFPEGLFESEFFGHCRGAFTGAFESRAGLFEQSTGGTLFLDEVGELPLPQQAKLLTALEEKRVRPVGASRARPVDARIVAATSRVITAEVAAGTFRADLYHRIALIRCELPPLRARPEDLRLLTSHLLDGLSRKYGRPGLHLTEAAHDRIAAHSWPGNVRELAHVLEAGVILSRGSSIDVAQLDTTMGGTTAPPTAARERSSAARSRGETGAGQEAPLGGRPLDAGAGSPGDLADVVDAPARPAEGGAERPAPRYSFFGSAEREREQIRGALVRCRGNKTRAAKALGMARNTLAEKVRKYGLEE